MGLHVATIWLADCVFALVSSWTGVTKKKKVRSVTKNETFFQSYQNNRFKWISKAIYWCFCNRHVIVNDIKIKNSGYEGLIHNFSSSPFVILLFFNTTSLPALTHLLFPIIKFPSSLFLFTSVFNQLTVSSAKERDKRGPSVSERTKKADRPIESGIPPKLAVNRLRIGCFNNPGGSWWPGGHTVSMVIR